jgi:hypothetical protein
MRSIVALLLVLLSGCMYSEAALKFSDHGLFSGDNPGNKTFKEVGPVAGSSTSWVFANCDGLARRAVEDLVDKSKALGGNAVFDVKFSGRGGPTAQPTCQRQLGWLLVFVPFPARVRVSGIAATIDGSDTPVGAIDLRREDAVEQILALADDR